MESEQVNRAREAGLNCSDITRADIKVTETTEHVAKILGKSQFTVQRMCASGVLPAKKIGKEWAISGFKLCEMLGIE